MGIAGDFHHTLLFLRAATAVAAFFAAHFAAECVVCDEYKTCMTRSCRRCNVIYSHLGLLKYKI